jgi:hypothetical protein
MIIKSVKLEFKFLKTLNHLEKFKQKWKKLKKFSLVN